MDNKPDAILTRFLPLHPKRIDLSLTRIERLLAALDHPERRLPPVIHVAGTNGKGSTIAFMRAILEAAGRSVHVYTSPHLVRFHERIRLGQVGQGTLVGDAELLSAFDRCERANAGAPITVFEITTAAAFLLFSEAPADYLLLETGLGGRVDATNVVDRPAASLITPISMDHPEFLGTTLSAIAREKAGIVKPGVPAIIGPQVPAVRALFEERAASLGAPLLIEGQDFGAREEHGRLLFEDERGLIDLPLPRLPGRHQQANAGLAIAALRWLEPLLATAALERGIVEAEWPARLQRLARGRLVDLAPQGSEIWLDGGHNAEGGRVLAQAMADFEDKASRPLILICGMLATKDTEAFLRFFAGLAQEVLAVPVPHQEHARAPEEIAAAARANGLEAAVSTSIGAALRYLAARPWTVGPRILIAGSLYLAGEALAANGTPPA
jgi:dihydrofolate synthase/folylpolyglutamate synthase